MSVTMTLAAAARATGGRWLRLQQSGERFSGVSTDSRAVSAGQAFLALCGEHFDGHDFLALAAARQPALLIVSRDLSAELIEGLPAAVSVLRVEDTRRALGELARAWRRQVAPTVVAITGSVGKTTTKELTRGVLAAAAPTHATAGNFNNDIGLPLTVLAMPEATRFLVLEMGMNAAGEIAYLTDLAEPAIGCVTSVAPAHLEGLGSLEAVAAAKGELLVGLPEGARAVVPGDQPLLEPYLRHLPPGRVLRFGSAPGDGARLVRLELQGSRGSRLWLSLRGGEPFPVELPLVGQHNARNAAAAAGIAALLDLEPALIARALAAAPDLGHRSALREIGAWHLLDDCYNANPVAMRAALDTIEQLSGEQPALAVLGAMLELGPESERYHQEVGEHAARCGLQVLVTVGPLGGAIAVGARRAGMPADRVLEVPDPAAAAEVVAARAGAGAWILIKASRGARLEGVLERLRELNREAPPLPSQG